MVGAAPEAWRADHLAAAAAIVAVVAAVYHQWCE